MRRSPFGTAAALWSQRAADRSRGFVHGGGNDLLAGTYSSTLAIANGIPNDGNTGAQMGGWFRKEDKQRSEDLQGPEFRDRRFRRHQSSGSLALCRSCWRTETSNTALEKGTIDAVEWIGPADDEKARFPRKSRNIITTPLGGRAVRIATLWSTWRNGMRCPKASGSPACGCT